MNALSNFDLTPFNRISVGMDSMFDNLLSNMEVGHQNYPPYNIVKHSDDHFAIELAVADFDKGDIDVETHDGQLVIKGETKIADDRNFVHQGIGARKFTRSFTLGEYVEVVSAEASNGILTVELKREVPEAMKPKTIAINYKK